MEFPVFKTKIKGVSQKFNLADPAQRQKYFQAKAGEEIKKLKKYLEKDTFIAYLLAKKRAGKGTYSRLLTPKILTPPQNPHTSGVHTGRHLRGVRKIWGEDELGLIAGVKTGIGKGVKVMESWLGANLAPALRIKGFKFTGVSQL